MKKIFVLFTIFFIIFFLSRSLLAQSPTVNPSTSSVSRYAACDFCGYCPPHTAPQSWSACKKCLYPALSDDPSTKASLLIDPTTNLAPTIFPGKQYTMLGCLGNGKSFTDESASASVVQSVLNIIFSAIGGIAFLYLLYGASIVATSQDNPERLNYGKRVIYGAIAGLLFGLFSVFTTKTISTGILKIPFSSSSSLQVSTNYGAPQATIAYTQPSIVASTVTPTPSLVPTFPIITLPEDNPTDTPILTPSLSPTPTTSLPSSTPVPTKTPIPTNTPVPAGACPLMDNGLPYSTARYPNASTSMPATTKDVCAMNGTSYYSVPFRNPACLATQAGIDRAYSRMQSYYPAYFSKTKLLKDWKTVQTYAKKYNFNPLFVISLWIEESAAGGATNATQLGCDYRQNKNGSYTSMPKTSSICDEMDCLFGLNVVYPGNYASFACQYRYGSDHWSGSQCDQAINFTMGIEFWYNLIAEGLSANCQVKLFSGANPVCISYQ
jgi:hypothetical protein